ncbi:MAG TPA: metal-dependent hydrolase [Polyangiales bacterium]|nr:metal-dependent hydrolase [Polyangiales bacterium]
MTHSLFGYALGRAFDRGDSRSRALLASSVVASNVPDLDFVTGFFAEDRRLDYLLQHRGFTHTLVFALVLGAIAGLCCALALRLKPSRDRLAVSAFGAAAALLHIACDWLNDYGVHPLYPFDDHWFYGDAVFIIEPLWLAALLPLPALFAWTRTGRVLSFSLGVGVLGLSWFVLPAGRAAAVSAFELAAVALQWKAGPRALPALAASAVLLSTFVVGSRMSDSQVRAALRAAAPGERVLDIASSPTPADPSCHRALVVSLDTSGTYRVRVARSQLFGSAAACQLLPGQPTAPLKASDISGSDRVRFESVFTAPVAQLAELARTHCDARAMLRFLRVPFWLERRDETVLGDLRYDRAPTIEFAERVLTGHCGNVERGVPWIPPRDELLRYFLTQNGLMPGTPSAERSKQR